MKLRYRIKIAFLKWLDRMHDRRIEREDRRILINSVLFDKMKGKKIKRKRLPENEKRTCGIPWRKAY